MTGHVASHWVPGGFQHRLTSFPVIMDESLLHKAGQGMLDEGLLCRKPGREVGLYLVDWDWHRGGRSPHDGAHV